MFWRSSLSIANVFLFIALWLGGRAFGQSSTIFGTETVDTLSTAGPSATVAPSGTNTETFRPLFTIPTNADNGAIVIPNIADPEAVDAQTVCPGYTASDVQRSQFGLTATLTLAGEACNVYGNDVDRLTLTVQYQSPDRLSVKIQPSNLSPQNTSWFILPESLVPSPQLDANANSTVEDNELEFFWDNDPSFSFSVIRKSTDDVLFSTAGTKLVYEDQFLEFVSTLPDNYNLYGLGETIHGLRLGNNFTKTIYAADVGDPIDLNIYGSHPFYVDTRYYEADSTGNLTLLTSNETDSSKDYVSYSHGLYNRNAHGQEIRLNPTNITWRALGGSMDLYFYAGPTVKDVTANHQVHATGLPAMQQYHTFGYHQCRWGYRNWSQVQDVVDNFAKFEIPLEHIWTDIDYMLQYRDFDNDPIRFGYDEGKAFTDKLHANGQYYIPIVDSAIYIPNPDNATDAYPIFNRGNDTNSFMLNPDDSLYIGDVWPGYTVFPDWLPESGANEWWINEMSTWHSNVNWSGIWIDMSEVSSFCVGSCGSGNLSLNPAHPPFGLPGEPGNVIYSYPEGFNLTNATEAASASAASASQSASLASASPSPTATGTVSYLRTTPTAGVRNVNHPPYVINNVQGDLAVHAVSPNATHHNGVEEYDVHNLFGHQILNATYHALLNVFPGKRPFIIGRSTFVGSGQWAGHWGGDNTAQFLYMYFSIPQALSFSLFGIPMFGVDTCGFNGNSDEELCNRWMQLSAFFPFYRNHNTLSAISQEPYVWSSVIDATKTAMSIRFQLLPYMYTLFNLAHATGSPVMRALAWEFPNDPSLADADRQFFLGPAILVTPVLEQGATSVNGVFPGAGKGEVYYDWYTQSAVNSTAGQNMTIDAPLGHIPVYVRGGNILPMQQPSMTTAAARKTPWSLLVALSLEGTASGSLYLDDGESLIPADTLDVNLAATRGSLYASGRGTYKDTNPLANITILGVPNAPSNATLNGKSLTGHISYNSTSKVAVIGDLQNLTSSGAWSNDWVLKW